MSLDAGKDRSVPDVSNSTFTNIRRAKSLDRRVTESSMTVSICSVIAMHVRVTFGMCMMSHFRGPQLHFIRHTVHQCSTSQNLLPPNHCTALLEFAEDWSKSLAGVIHSICGWSLGQIAAASKPHPLRVADTRSCTHQCCCRHWWL